MNNTTCSVNMYCNNDHYSVSQYIGGVFILDTILIPYTMFVADAGINQWIKTLNDHHNISIFVNNVEYKSFLIKNAPSTYIKDNTIKILYLGEEPESWFIKLDIGKGFDIEKDKNILSSAITIKIQDKLYPVGLGLTNNTGIQLIRTKLISNDLYAMIMKDDINIDFYKDDGAVRDMIYQSCCSCHFYQNLYMVGSCLVVDPMSDLVNYTLLNLDTTKIDTTLINKQLDTANNNQKFLTEINNIDNKILFREMPQSLKMGSIGLLFNSRINSHKIECFKYDQYTHNNEYINSYEHIDNILHINHLTDGIYVIKIIDDLILEKINNKPYSEHYNASLEYIAGSKLDNINYEHGDILVILYDDNNIYNFPGISEMIIQQNKPSTKPKQFVIDVDISVSHQLKIICKHSIPYIISGPDNFSMETSGNASLNNLKTGVYKIIPNSPNLDPNKIKEVFIHQNSKKIILLNFA